MSDSHYALHREGIPSERVQCVGSLIGCVSRATRDAMPDPAEVLRRFGVAPAALDLNRPFGLMTLAVEPGGSLTRPLDALLARLKGAVPLLWLVDRATAEAVKAAALEKRLKLQHVTMLPMIGLLDSLALLSRAALLIGDESQRLGEEAMAMNVPCLELAADGANAEALARAVGDVLAAAGERRDPVADPADQCAAEAVAQWLAGLEGDPKQDAGNARRPSRHR